MNIDEIRKLLGGYATGTLTPEENKRLMAAAMEDQRIFDALADEEALRELLDDPAFRQELLVELRKTDPGVAGKIGAWWRRPLPLAFAGGLAAVALAAVLLVPAWQPDEPVELAMQRAKAPEESADALREQEAEAPEQFVAPLEYRKTEDKNQSKKETGGDPAGAEPGKPAAGRVGVIGGVPPMMSSSPLRKDDSSAPPAAEEKAVASRVSAPPEAYRRLRQRGEVEELDAPDSQMALAFRSEERQSLADAPARSAPAPTTRNPHAIPIQMRLERSTGDGVWVTLEDGGTAALGDMVRAELIAPADGYVQLFHRDGDGRFQPFSSAQVSEGSPFYTPSSGGLPRPSQPVERTVAAVFTPQPIPEGWAITLALSDNGGAVLVRFRYE